MRYNTNFGRKPIAGADNTTPLVPFVIKGPTDLAQVAGDLQAGFDCRQPSYLRTVLRAEQFAVSVCSRPKVLGLGSGLRRSKANNELETGSIASQWQTACFVDHSVGEGRHTVSDSRRSIGSGRIGRRIRRFVVAALKMVGYLSSFRAPDTGRVAGTPMRWDFSSQEMLA